ncbi:MAG: epimerase [Candidatus Hydrogenedentes bacterium]|nr:epimerase [Candidatus Hydrogenedentota bacterium]
MIADVEQLEELLSRPPARLVEAMRGIEGDVLVLGAGGKMGPTLTRMAARAIAEAGTPSKVYAVSTFSNPEHRKRLDKAGVVTHAGDISDPKVVEALPNAKNVVYMVGRKFGSSGAEWDTWVANVLVPARIADRYADANVVVFSSGNVYPLTAIELQGATEDTTPAPVGEYAMTCLGRERMFDHAAHHKGLRAAHYRLNYAVELRYGILVDVAEKVLRDEPIDVTMGYVNVVWQGYANAVAMELLAWCANPPFVLNVTGPETVSVRALAERFGALFGKTPEIRGEEARTALLSNATRCHTLFGLPEIGVDSMVDWVADWLLRGGATLNKPTHYETRDGRF